MQGTLRDGGHTAAGALVVVAFFARGLAVLALVLVAAFFGAVAFLAVVAFVAVFFGAATFFVVVFGLVSLTSFWTTRQYVFSCIGRYVQTFGATAFGAAGLASFFASFTGPEGPGETRQL